MLQENKATAIIAALYWHAADYEHHNCCIDCRGRRMLLFFGTTSTTIVQVRTTAYGRQ